jgi:hypothetical protein
MDQCCCRVDIGDWPVLLLNFPVPHIMNVKQLTQACLYITARARATDSPHMASLPADTSGDGANGLVNRVDEDTGLPFLCVPMRVISPAPDTSASAAPADSTGESGGDSPAADDGSPQPTVQGWRDLLCMKRCHAYLRKIHKSAVSIYMNYARNTRHTSLRLADNCPGEWCLC